MTPVAGQELCSCRHWGRSIESCRLTSQSKLDFVYLTLKAMTIACTDLCGFDIKQLIPFRKESRARVEIWEHVGLSIADLSYDSGHRRQILRRQLSNRIEKMEIKNERRAWLWYPNRFIAECILRHSRPRINSVPIIRA